MTKDYVGFNHQPDQVGVWFMYNGWRFKDVYHIKLLNGDIHKFMYPNGDNWRPDVGNTQRLSFADQDIVEVMLVTDAELEAVESFRFVGKKRIRYNLEVGYGS